MADNITISEALKDLNQQTAVADKDRLALVTAGGKAQTATLANVRNSLLSGNQLVNNFGEYNTWAKFETALLQITTQGVYFGTLNGVGISIKVVLLGNADKHYLFEISGGIQYDTTSTPTNLALKATDHWHTFVRESRNNAWVGKWQVEGGHYYLGNFDNISQAWAEAAKPYVGGNESISTIRYNALNGNGDEHSSGYMTIFQNVQDNIVMQYLYIGQKIRYRTLRFTDATRTQIADIGTFVILH